MNSETESPFEHCRGCEMSPYGERSDREMEFIKAHHEANERDQMAVEEASSILLSIKIQLEKRSDLTVVEKELIHTIEEWHQVHPMPTEVT